MQGALHHTLALKSVSSISFLMSRIVKSQAFKLF
jgi:hypothetical protein